MWQVGWAFKLPLDVYFLWFEIFQSLKKLEQKLQLRLKTLVNKAATPPSLHTHTYTYTHTHTHTHTHTQREKCRLTKRSDPLPSIIINVCVCLCFPSDKYVIINLGFADTVNLFQMSIYVLVGGVFIYFTRRQSYKNNDATVQQLRHMTHDQIVLGSAPARVENFLLQAKWMQQQNRLPTCHE